MDQLRNVEQVEELCRYPPILPLIPPICLAPPKLALLLVSIQHQIPSEGGLIWPPLPSPPSSPAPLSPSLDASLCLGCRIDKLSDIPLPLGNAASGGCSWPGHPKPDMCDSYNSSLPAAASTLQPCRTAILLLSVSPWPSCCL